MFLYGFFLDNIFKKQPYFIMSITNMQYVIRNLMRKLLKLEKKEQEVT